MDFGGGVPVTADTGQSAIPSRKPKGMDECVAHVNVGLRRAHGERMKSGEDA